MATSDATKCTSCGGVLKHYDKVKRILRTKGGVKRTVEICRLRCESCRAIRRVLPDFIFPYKHYEAEIIKGVLDGFITPLVFGYEDYPCDMTMRRWTRENNISFYEDKR